MGYSALYSVCVILRLARFILSYRINEYTKVFAEFCPSGSLLVLLPVVVLEVTGSYGCVMSSSYQLFWLQWERGL